MDWQTPATILCVMGGLELLKAAVQARRNAREFLGMEDKPQKAELTNQPIRVEMEEKFLKRSSFYSWRDEHQKHHDQHDARLRVVEKEAAAQATRSELNGARLVEVSAKLDRVVERLKA
jgi:hypothetical protein